MTQRKTLHIDALSGYEPEIGRWLCALEQVRERTLHLISDLDQRTLDWRGEAGKENSISSLLYHVALVEVSWLFYDILLQDFPPEIADNFPYPMATNNAVTHIEGLTLEDHLTKLQSSRSTFQKHFKNMTLKDWRSFRSPPEDDYRVTPEWAVFHLIEHEAGHAAQISSLSKRVKRQLLSEEKS